MCKMDNFNVPKYINRNVMRALGILQGTHSLTAFVPANSIIRQVEQQMRRNKHSKDIKEYVLKSLCSLTYLGVLVRTGLSDYALRQALVFEDGTSAIPWRRSSNRTLVSSSVKFAKKKPSIRKRTLKARKNRSRAVARRSKTCRTSIGRNSDNKFNVGSDQMQQMDINGSIDEEMSVSTSDSIETPIVELESNASIFNSRWDFKYPIPISAPRGF